MPTFESPQPISVSVELGVADLRLVAGDRADTVVDVQPSDPAKPSDVTAAQQTHVEYVNGALQIRAPKGLRRYSPWGGGEAINVRIELPAGSSLQGKAAMAALTVAGTLGDCRYKTAAGDITVEQVSGAAELATSTGAVRIGRIGGPASVKNGNGDTWVGEVAGVLAVKAANGKITVDLAHSTAALRTANGDIQIGEVASGAIVAETACGRVDVGVRAGVAAWLDLHTGCGRVEKLLDTGGQPERSQDTVEVRARSSFGDITIRRAGVAGVAAVAA